MQIVGALPERRKCTGSDPRGSPASRRLLDGPEARLVPFRGSGRHYFGTLKIAIRFEPILMVSNSVPTNTRFSPRTKTSRQPVPLVILSPLLAFLPCIVISLVAT